MADFKRTVGRGFRGLATGFAEEQKQGERQAFQLRKQFLKRRNISKMNFNDASRLAVQGVITFDDLDMLFPTRPDKVDELRARHTKIQQSPTFKKGTGTPVSRVKSFVSPKQAEINADTQFAIDQIKTEFDFEEFIADAEKGLFKGTGIDPDAVFEAFGKPRR